MKKKKICIVAVVTLVAMIAVIMYFDLTKSTKEVYEGTLVWKEQTYEN